VSSDVKLKDYKFDNKRNINNLHLIWHSSLITTVNVNGWSLGRWNHAIPRIKSSWSHHNILL